MVRLTFHRVVDGVTGLLYLLRADTKTILMKCRFFPGGRGQVQVSKFEFLRQANDGPARKNS